MQLLDKLMFWRRHAPTTIDMSSLAHVVAARRASDDDRPAVVPAWNGPTVLKAADLRRPADDRGHTGGPLTWAQRQRADWSTQRGYARWFR